jgi:hypothetical protein
MVKLEESNVGTAIEWLYSKADQYEGIFNSESTLMEFDPEWILERVDTLRKVLGNDPGRIIHGKLETRFQKNWYQGIYSCADASSMSGYLSKSSRNLINAFSEYVNITKMKYRNKTRVDVALGTEVLEWIADDLNSAIKSQGSSK